MSESGRPCVQMRCTRPPGTGLPEIGLRICECVSVMRSLSALTPREQELGAASAGAPGPGSQCSAARGVTTCAARSHCVAVWLISCPSLPGVQQGLQVPVPQFPSAHCVASLQNTESHTNGMWRRGSLSPLSRDHFAVFLLEYTHFVPRSSLLLHESVIGSTLTPGGKAGGSGHSPTGFPLHLGVVPGSVGSWG